MEITLTNADIEDNEYSNLSVDELKIFAQEIAEMALKGKSIDLKKAIHNAKYFAEIGRRLKNVDEGKNLVSFTEEEWEKFTNENRI